MSMASRETALPPDAYGAGFHFRPDEIVRCFISKRRHAVDLSPLVRRRAGSVSSLASVTSFGEIDQTNVPNSSPKDDRRAKADNAATYGFHSGSHNLRRKLSNAVAFPEDYQQAATTVSNKAARSKTLPGHLRQTALVYETFAEQAAAAREARRRKLSRLPSTPVPGGEKGTSSFAGRLSSLLNRLTSRDGISGEAYSSLKKKTKTSRMEKTESNCSCDSEEDEYCFVAASATGRTDQNERVALLADVELSVDHASDSSSDDEIMADSASVNVLADSSALGSGHQSGKGHDEHRQQHAKQSMAAFTQRLPLISVSENVTAVEVCADSGLGGESVNVAACDRASCGVAAQRQESLREVMVEKIVDGLLDIALQIHSKHGDLIKSFVKSFIANSNITTYQLFSDWAMQLLTKIHESTTTANANLSDNCMMALLLHFTAQLVSSLPSHLKDFSVTVESHGVRLIDEVFHNVFLKALGVTGGST